MNNVFDEITYLCLLLCGLCFSYDCLSHGVTHDRLHDLNHDIQHEPDNGTLYLKRGRVHVDAEHWNNALADFQSAFAKNSNLHEALYWQGFTLLHMNKIEQSHNLLTRYLNLQAQSPAGHRTLAQLLSRKGQYTQSAHHYDLAIQYDKKPRPQVYLDRYETLKHIQPLPIERMAQGLKEGIDRHGELINFLELMVDLYQTSGDSQNALYWHSKYPQALHQSPQWQVHHADLLTQADKQDEAVVLYRKVLRHIRIMPTSKRSLAAMQDAAGRAEEGLKALNALSISSQE